MKMNKLITTAVATLFLSGCDVIVDKPRVWHDSKRFVTCYMSPAMESIYCITDNQPPNYSKEIEND